MRVMSVSRGTNDTMEPRESVSSCLDPHPQPFARLIRNVVRRGTGRPVAPFFLPVCQAVPAMSKWAQSYLRVNFDKKQAAVTLPAGRPPIFEKSAKLLLSCL